MNLRLQWEMEKGLLKECLNSAKSFFQEFLGVDEDGFQKAVASIETLPNVVVLDITGEKAWEHLPSFFFVQAAAHLFVEMHVEIAKFKEIGKVPFGDAWKEVLTNSFGNLFFEKGVDLLQKYRDSGHGDGLVEKDPQVDGTV